MEKRLKWKCERGESSLKSIGNGESNGKSDG